MARYKIEDLKKEFTDLGWELISNKYTNLTTQLEMICPNGHTVYQTYDKFRHNHLCPICARKHLDIKENIQSKPKAKGVIRTLALDQATRTSGWSIFDDENLIKYGSFTIDGQDTDLRIDGVKNRLINMLEFWRPDKVVLEDIQLQQFGPKSTNNIEGVTVYKTLAQLQGVLINVLIECDIPFLLAHTGTWRECCGIKGKTRSDRKRSAQLIVKEYYGVSATQDEADAICIGMYGSAKTKKNNSMVSWE